MYQVKDAMIRNVVSILPTATIEEAIRKLLEHKISGAPVIDQQGRLVGIISQFQLLEVLYDPQIRTQRIQQFMTKEVLTLEDTALLGTAASLFVLHRIHRIPVLSSGRVVGIISRSDLLKYFLETGEKIEAFFDNLKSANGSETAACATV